MKKYDQSVLEKTNWQKRREEGAKDEDEARDMDEDEVEEEEEAITRGKRRFQVDKKIFIRPC